MVQLLAGLISAPYLCFPAWGRKCLVDSGTGSRELMAEGTLQREPLCCRDVENQTAIRKPEKYKDQQRRVKHRFTPERRLVAQAVLHWRLRPAC